MNKKMIVKIEEFLENLKGKPIKIKQTGYLINQFFMDKMMYKIQNDILNLRDEINEIYLSINLNQIYQIEIGKNKMMVFFDNDLEIEISL